jgi:hypothetical protein
LGRHRLHKVRPDEAVNKSVSPASAPNSTPIAAMGIPQFLKRMSMGVMSK